MWIVPFLAAAVVAAPAEYVRVDCPWVPTFFEAGSTRLSEGAKRNTLPGYLNWFASVAARPEVRVVLRTYSRGRTSIAVKRLSEVRARKVRQFLVASGLRPDHIQIEHETYSGPEQASEDFRGAWVYPEFYLTRAASDRLIPPGSGFNC